MKILNNQSIYARTFLRRSELIIGMTLTLSIGMPLAFANQYEAQEGVATGNGFGIGVSGELTVESTDVSPSGFSNHRDFMVYINDASVSSSVGAGWYTQANGVEYDLVYAYPIGGFPSHNLYTQLTAGTTFPAQVTEKNNDPTSKCWDAVTDTSGSVEYCFTSSTQSGASNVGMVGRTFSAYSSGTNDLYGLFDSLEDEYHTSGGTNGWEDFSTAANTNYKCWSSSSGLTSNGYVFDGLANYGTYSAKVDKVGTGPRTYTGDTCSNVTPAYDPYGENGSAGGS